MGHLNRRYTSSPQIFYPNFILIEIMIELSTIRDLVAIFGVIAGFSYYVLTVRANQRNQQMQIEARRLDIFMRWHIELTKPELMKNITELLTLEWEDFDDFQKKHDHTVNPEGASKRFSIWYYWGGLGYLLAQKMIDSDTVYDMVGNAPLAMWIKYKPIIEAYRIRDGRPENWRWFEYLANEIEKTRKQKELSEYEPPIK